MNVKDRNFIAMVIRTTILEGEYERGIVVGDVLNVETVEALVDRLSGAFEVIDDTHKEQH